MFQNSAGKKQLTRKQMINFILTVSQYHHGRDFYEIEEYKQTLKHMSDSQIADLYEATEYEISLNNYYNYDI